MRQSEESEACEMSDWLSPQAATLLEAMATLNDTIRCLKRELENEQNDHKRTTCKLEKTYEICLERKLGTVEVWGFKFNEEIKK